MDMKVCSRCVFNNYGRCTNNILCSEHNLFKDRKWLKKEGVKEMKKTFKEVIADIKEGEVWEPVIVGNVEKIENDDNDIRIIFRNPTPSYLFTDFSEYKLQRKKVTFAAAFKAYEEGKEIESCVDNCIFKKINGEDNYKFNKHNTFSTKCDEEDYWFDFNHIRGEWYINA